MIEFMFPQTQGEWFAWASAVILLIRGGWLLFAAQIWPAQNPKTRNSKKDKLDRIDTQTTSVLRVHGGGLSLGFAIAILLLHPQPLMYFALGLGYIGMALGRIISLFLDQGVMASTIGWLCFDLSLASLTLLYALGYVN